LKIFNKFKWITHPITVLVGAQICWGLLMFVWIRWYILRSEEIDHLVQKIPLPQKNSGQWIILVEGCILMAFILAGLYMIFAHQRRMSKLAKMQDAILSSVTHELKTPLASIRLYTETLLLRTVSEQDKLKFLKRTLSEAERLQRLIDTVLISARLQTGNSSVHLSRMDVKDILNASINKAKNVFPIKNNLRPIYPKNPSIPRPTYKAILFICPYFSIISLTMQ
jgi:signal transduction histidine kinase